MLISKGFTSEFLGADAGAVDGLRSSGWAFLSYGCSITAQCIFCRSGTPWLSGLCPETCVRNFGAEPAQPSLLLRLWFSASDEDLALPLKTFPCTRDPALKQRVLTRFYHFPLCTSQKINIQHPNNKIHPPKDR